MVPWLPASVNSVLACFLFISNPVGLSGLPYYDILYCSRWGQSLLNLRNSTLNNLRINRGARQRTLKLTYSTLKRISTQRRPRKSRPNLLDSTPQSRRIKRRRIQRKLALQLSDGLLNLGAVEGGSIQREGVFERDEGAFDGGGVGEGGEGGV